MPPTGRYEEIIVDQGIEDKRLLVIEPEFARTLRVTMRDGNRSQPTNQRAG